MKTQKIILLALVFILTLALASCGSDTAGAPDWLDFKKDSSFTDITELEGEVVDHNADYNLVALSTTTVDTTGNVTEYIKVYDLADSNRLVLTTSYNFYSGSRVYDYDVDLSSYPIITSIMRSTSESFEGEIEYHENRNYYLITNEGEARQLAGSYDEDLLYVEEIGNIYLVELAGKLMWINRNLAVMREVNLDVSETYRGSGYEAYFQFEAEFCDYLYTWEFNPQMMSQTVVVYDPNGIASAKYDFSSGVAYVQDSSDGLINPSVFVLNNGNVLIQECIMVEGDGAYDFIYNLGATPYKLDLVTRVMDYKTGAITDVECDMLIKDLESAYTASECGTTEFPFTLAKGDNQAYVISVKGGVVGRSTEYVVLDNELNTVYTLNNRYIADSSSYDTITNVSTKGYEASAYVNGAFVECFFNWDGEIVFKHPTNYIGSVAGEYYVTPSGVYTNAGKLVFDIENSEFGNLYDADVEIVGDIVYLYRTNYLELDEYGRNAEEVYKLNLKDGKAELVADGVDVRHIALTTDGAYMVNNKKKETASFYNRNGELVLVVSEDDLVEIELLDDTFYVCVEVGNEYKMYAFVAGDTLPDRK